MTLLPYAMLAVWLVAQLGGVLAFYRSPVHGQDGVHEISAQLRQDVQPGDLVVANHALLPASIAQYYDGHIRALPENRDIRDGYILWPTPDIVDFAPAEIELLKGLLAQSPQRVWLLYLPVMDHHGTLLATFNSLYRQIEAQHYLYCYCDLYLFTLKTP